jgi:ABC-type sulfate transport system permease component
LKLSGVQLPRQLLLLLVLLLLLLLLLLALLHTCRAAAKLAVQDYHGALSDAQAAVAVDDK